MKSNWFPNLTEAIDGKFPELLMEYEVIFDVRNSSPPFPSGIILAAAIAALFMVARFWPAGMDGLQSRYMQAGAGLALVKRGMPIATLLFLAVPTVLATASVLSKKWLWALGLAAIIASVSLYSFMAARLTIAALSAQTNGTVITGVVSGLRDYYVSVNASGPDKSYKERFDVAGHHFDYYATAPGSPYSLEKGNRPFANGHQVRITTSGGAILKVERQLCLVSAPCTVSYPGGVRLEQPLN